MHPISALAETKQPAPEEFLLRLGDNALILSHRLSEWTGHGPALEEDIALTNTALDLLGQARMLYSHAGQNMQPVCDEDALAYWRNAEAFRNFTALELPNSGVHAARGALGDYALRWCVKVFLALICWSFGLWWPNRQTKYWLALR
jgi:ring-1,2-phenylacetyl-CoA epoxidase subunit PaaC